MISMAVCCVACE